MKTSPNESPQITQATIQSSYTPISNQGRRSPAFKTGNDEADRISAAGPTSTLRFVQQLCLLFKELKECSPSNSPNNVGFFGPNGSYTHESPLNNGSHSSYPYLALYPPIQRTSSQKTANEEVQVPILLRQMATPESSPFARTASRYTGTATPRQIRPPPSEMNPFTPKMANQEAPRPSATPTQHVSSPTTSSDTHTSQLSSPFVPMAKLSVADKASKSKHVSRSRVQSYSPDLQPMQVDDPASASRSKPSQPTHFSTGSSPPRSPLRSEAGGEMERIRQAMIQERLAQYHDAEIRRPDYLKRAKRAYPETDSMAAEDDREPGVGITESPMKGRRLMLFQETSEESFEESLMAGGYGRYRTADWVRQPQPVLLATPGAQGSSSVVSALEKAEEPPPLTEKEIRKRKRLAAFSDRANSEGLTKLQPVELEGRGRVILDIPPEGDEFSPIEGSPSKKKGTGRRRKKGELTTRDKKALAFAAAAVGDLPEKPNWPDTEFPWRVRTQERNEELKAEEAEKLKVIERFLDRDTDDEEEEEGVGIIDREDTPFRRGRGKTVALPGHSPSARKSLFLTDPADARAVLMSKKSVRTLSYRQQKRRRQRNDEESDDEVLCICNGRDDGRELVQCDECQTWYHLECIGIRDISELGREEDPWFCRRCMRSPPSSPEPEVLSEPTFAPTDDRPRISPFHDAPFFQPLQDSPAAWDHPRMPRTPTRFRDPEYEQREISSGVSWGESRHRPTTPQQPSSVPRVYTQHTPGPFESYGQQDEPFDPTSTPSRGIRFGAPFATPKNGAWSSRANGLFQTPTMKISGGRNSFGNFGGLSSSWDGYDGVQGAAYDRTLHDDESPIRRVKSHDNPSKGRHILDSPLGSRAALPMPRQLFEESPVMRYDATVTVKKLDGDRSTTRLATAIDRRERLRRPLSKKMPTDADRFRIAVALVALKFKPPGQSFSTYALELRSKFSTSSQDSDAWRTLALKLERDLEDLKEKYEADQIKLFALENGAMPVPSLPAPNSSSEQTVPPKKKTKKKSATTPASYARPDLKLIMDELNSRGDDGIVPRILPPAHHSLFSALDNLSRLTSLHEVEVGLLSSVTLRAVEAIAKEVKDILLSPTSPSDTRVLERLGTALQHVLEISLPPLKQLLSQTSEPIISLLDKTARTVLSPIIHAFPLQSETYLGSLFSPPASLTESLKPPAAPVDIRTDMLELFRRIFCYLDENLQSFAPSSRPTLVSQTFRASLILEAIRQVERLLSSLPAADRTHVERVKKLATKDSLWYLFTVLHILLGNSSTSQNQNRPATFSVIFERKGEIEVQEGANPTDDHTEDEASLLSKAISDSLLQLVTRCRRPSSSPLQPEISETTIEAQDTSPRSCRSPRRDSRSQASMRGELVERRKAGLPDDVDGDSGRDENCVPKLRDGNDEATGAGADADADVDVNADGQRRKDSGNDRPESSVPPSALHDQPCPSHSGRYQLDEVEYGMLLGVLERYWVWSKSWDIGS
ncbi:hypothetical protein H0H92_007403 [Tricholoma furcatifolium]|nr:hypothetical protein H0H92_007403 [Tricholoma furcatifolium]